MCPGLACPSDRATRRLSARRWSGAMPSSWTSSRQMQPPRCAGSARKGAAGPCPTPAAGAGVLSALHGWMVQNAEQRVHPPLLCVCACCPMPMLCHCIRVVSSKLCVSLCLAGSL